MHHVESACAKHRAKCKFAGPPESHEATAEGGTMTRSLSGKLSLQCSERPIGELVHPDLHEQNIMKFQAQQQHHGQEQLH